MFARELKAELLEKITSHKVLLIFGTRRVGKTVLIKEVIKEFAGQTLVLNGEDDTVHQLLEPQSIANYRSILDGIKLLVIDEAQAIPRIGNKLKLMIDEIEDLTIIASGSSAFDLSNKTGEPLTGRAHFYKLYPLAQCELSKQENILQTKQLLEERLIYGTYPEVVGLTSAKAKATYLKEIVNSYLLKDILMFDGLRNSNKISQLVRLVAYQIGQEVSFEELGKQLGMSKNTVERYLDLLATVDILYPLSAYTSNHRKEITKAKKWYFTDNGIRNAIINEFKPLNMRTDVGHLWESYFIMERIKRNNCKLEAANYYFWRTYDRQEVDFIEERGESIVAFETKWNKTYGKIPGFFAKTYADVPFHFIHPSNYLQFIM